MNEPQGGTPGAGQQAVHATAFPEIGWSMDPKKVPWADAIVWSERTGNGHRIYEWLTKEHVANVGWTNGLVSVQVANESFLFDSIRYFIVQAPFVAVGQNVSV